jgi:hypothetical protein
VIPPGVILIEWSRPVNDTLWFWALLGISVILISDPARCNSDWVIPPCEWYVWFWALLGISVILISDPARCNSDWVIPPCEWHVMVLGPFRDFGYINQWSRPVEFWFSDPALWNSDSVLPWETGRNRDFLLVHCSECWLLIGPEVPLKFVKGGTLTILKTCGSVIPLGECLE